MKDPCQRSPCQNGGKCDPKLGSDRGFKCHCPLGYAGELCEVANPCATKPCQNSGQCKPQGNYDFTCTCPGQYYGKLCQYKSVTFSNSIFLLKIRVFWRSLISTIASKVNFEASKLGINFWSKGRGCGRGGSGGGGEEDEIGDMIIWVWGMGVGHKGRQPLSASSSFMTLD